MPWLNDLKRTVQKLSKKPRAERRAASGLAASYGLDSSYTPTGIKNISATGIYLVTEKRLHTGELITLTIEEQGEPENSSDLHISVHARVARQGEDGVGLSFVLPPGLDTRLWGVLVRNIVVLTDKSQIAQMFRTLRAILFLCRICQSEAEEAILLQGGQLGEDYTETAVKIALSAENLLASEPGADRIRAHPKQVASILKGGSWSLDEALTQLWTGLLVSSCSADAADDSNQVLVDLLIHITPSQAKIFIHGCERTLDSKPGDENSASASIVLNSKEMVSLTGEHDLTRNAADVAYLFNLGMLRKVFDFSSYRDFESFDIAPSSLGIELFKHCRGDRGRIEPHLVETAKAHLLNFIPASEPIVPDEQIFPPQISSSGS